ncbi:AAA family ATPase [Pseudenhygromyxa sp. WMMC2535]|uniref:AAA family ATPase n=1 Tax=Pseudenhygromyxa sp. WMMC2535 TaxID=2712867 RepID=UPI001C3C9D26
MRTLEKLTIRGFKSIRDQSLALGPLNLFIGANGAGKSNLIEVFRFLREIVTQNLQRYTAIKGGPDALLHFGRKQTPELHFELEFGGGWLTTAYEVALIPTEYNKLILSHEYVEKESGGGTFGGFDGIGAPESVLKGHRDDEIVRHILADLENYRVYHFHDTSSSAPMKQLGDVDDNRYLRAQAENLAAYLYFLQQKHPEHFALIEGSVRQIAPFFDRFALAPSRLDESRIQLEWKERGRDNFFKASALSDGTLRFICLATLLLQPELPGLVILDEPELGLHPAAITMLAEMLSAAATRTQVVAATQSVTLIDQFEPKQVWAVERDEKGASRFRCLASEDMSAWLDDYSLGELWEKNLLGARP